MFENGSCSTLGRSLSLRRNSGQTLFEVPNEGGFIPNWVAPLAYSQCTIRGTVIPLNSALLMHI